MTPLRFVAASSLLLALASCSAQKPDAYDTTPSRGAGAESASGAASNPVYDTPAAYDESSAAVTPVGGATGQPAIAPYNPEPPATTPSAPVNPPAAPAPAHTPSVNGAATIHTVVAGDTLSGIAAKYKVPAAAIKQANNMTKDTVILGRKMVIPPAR